MRGVKKKRPMPAEHKAPVLFPGWRVLLPAAGVAAAVIAVAIVLKGGQGTLPGGRETITEVAQPISIAPLAGEDEGLLGRGIGLNGGTGSIEGEGIAFNPGEKAALAEALSQLAGDEDLTGQFDTLNERELERFDRLLSAKYSLS
jgi:hypothetical protein